MKAIIFGLIATLGVMMFGVATPTIDPDPPWGFFMAWAAMTCIAWLYLGSEN